MSSERAKYDHIACIVCHNRTTNEKIHVCFGCFEEMDLKLDKTQEKIILRNSCKDNFLFANTKCNACLKIRCATIHAVLCNYHTEIVYFLQEKARKDKDKDNKKL